MGTHKRCPYMGGRCRQPTAALRMGDHKSRPYRGEVDYYAKNPMIAATAARPMS